MTRTVTEVTAEAGAKLVFADNLSMNGPVDGPMTEESPPVAQTKKGKVRAAMAAELMAAHRDGTLHVVIGRSSDYFCPGARATPSANASSKRCWPATRRNGSRISTSRTLWPTCRTWHEPS
jgi:nucleoside-diphosphate-sugar epimerase